MGDASKTGAAAPESSSAASEKPTHGVAARAGRGRSARAATPRSAQSQFKPADDRRDPVELLQDQIAGHPPELARLRLRRMLASPLTFFRGSAGIMAADLAATPRSGLMVQALGDAHLTNFGIFAGPGGRPVFDISDFDQTLRAPWEWDVKRLVTSVEVAARVGKIGGRDRRTVVEKTVNAYRRAMLEFAEQPNQEVWSATLDADRLAASLGKHLRRNTAKDAKKSKKGKKPSNRVRSWDSLPPLRSFTHTGDGIVQFVSEPPAIVRLADAADPDAPAADHEHAATLAALADYAAGLRSDDRVLFESYAIADVARKVSGIGGIGARTVLVLLTGRDPGDLAFLQLRDAEPSALAPYVSDLSDEPDALDDADRVIRGQLLLQTCADPLLGVARAGDGPPRTVRQLRDWLVAADLGHLGPRDLLDYASACAWTLARGHARSGDRIAIAKYLGKSDRLDRSVADFAAAYADQNESDYQALRAAAAHGRVDAGE